MRYKNQIFATLWCQNRYKSRYIIFFYNVDIFVKSLFVVFEKVIRQSYYSFKEFIDTKIHIPLGMLQRSFIKPYNVVIVLKENCDPSQKISCTMCTSSILLWLLLWNDKYDVLEMSIPKTCNLTFTKKKTTLAIEMIIDLPDVQQRYIPITSTHSLSVKLSGCKHLL